MSIRLYNSLTKTKEDFAPIDAKNVRMYVCGPTVYDFAHIGNARPVIVFDVLFRLLRHTYGDAHVTYVRNITDVDDKINARAAERGISIRELTEETARIYEEDVAALGNIPPTVTPRATEHIAQMIAIIEQLVAAGHAYAADGHVLFDVSSKPDYGKLSRRSLDEMIAGARVEVAPYKRNAMDFVLWKPSDAALPGWDSPWGRGRPGWHIECSAMAFEYLGETFDIHGGGIDLQFPHHENEIAQSEGAHHNHPLAMVWMHNGFLQVEGEKMSKSLGNFFTINDLLRERKFGARSWSGEALRLTMLKTHYRRPIDWTLESLEESFVELRNWSNALSHFALVNELIGRQSVGMPPQPPSEVVEALSDDLNTPDVITVMRNLFKQVAAGDASSAVKLAESCEFLGLLRLDRLSAYNNYHVGTGPRLLPSHLRCDVDEVQTAFINNDFARVERLREHLADEGVSVTVLNTGAVSYEVHDKAGGVDVVVVRRLIEMRNTARIMKNFAESDRIRDELLAQGIVLKDGPQGTTWDVKK